MKFVIIDLDTKNVVSKVDLSKCSEYHDDEYDRFIADNLDLQENILILFEDDIDYDFDKLHQGLKVFQDGHVEDIRPTKYIYMFHIEKTLSDSKEVVSLGIKEYKFDEELSDKDIEELRVAVGATRVSMKSGKYPSDDELYRIEGKSKLIKDIKKE